RHGERLDLRPVPDPVRGRVRAAAGGAGRGHRHRPEGPLMEELLVNQFLLLGAILFCTGVYGVIARKNTVLVLMSIELILNAVNTNVLTFGALRGDVAGAVFALFIIAVAAAEVGVGLAMVLIIYRNRSSVDLDDVDSMRGGGWGSRARVTLDHPPPARGQLLSDPVLREAAAPQGQRDRHRRR